MKKKKGIILSLLGIIGLIAITVGVTYAFFNYTKTGTTENVVTSGTITFLYTEVSGVGKGISINDAYPIPDSQGKLQTGEGKVFDFKVTSNTSSSYAIPYEVTARKKIVDNLLDEDAVKLYLTKVTGTSEEEVLLSKYSDLTQTDKVESTKHIEKTIYNGKVPADSNKYEQAYRLRMWISDDTDFSPTEDGTYPYNNKTFTITVNVYANAKVVTEEDIENEAKAEISSLSVNGTELTKVEGQNYDYETTLDEGTTTASINVETISEYATVNIERLDSLAYSSNIKRLSTIKTLDLNPGDNYFKTTVTSENGEVENEYKIKISVVMLLSKAIFNTNKTIYENPTLTTSSNNTTDPSGLYKSTETNDGSPTYYFRGNVENNYVDFAGFTWRIVRINEDGTIRLIMQDGINGNKKYAFNATNYSSYPYYPYMYYSNSEAKTTLETWYQTNIVDKEYSSYVATGAYFCEEAKVTCLSDFTSGSVTSGNATMTSYSNYISKFTCSTDGNGYGILNGSIGLITYDEVVFAGAYYQKNNSSYYLYNEIDFWTMSPTGVYSNPIPYAIALDVTSSGFLSPNGVNDSYALRPVLILKADTSVTGLGTSESHWVVQ